MRSGRPVRPTRRRSSVDVVVVAGRARHEVGLRPRRSRPPRKFRQKSFGVASRRNPQLARVPLRFPGRTTGDLDALALT